MRVPLTVCFQFPDPLGTVRVYVYSTWECTCKCACCFARSDKFGLSAGSATACNITLHTLFTSDTATVTLCLFLVLALLCFFMCLGCFPVSFLEFNLFLVSLFCADYYCSVIKVRKITGNFHSCFHQGKPRIQCARQVNGMWIIITMCYSYFIY
jgi:hypothetical protein